MKSKKKSVEKKNTKSKRKKAKGSGRKPRKPVMVRKKNDISKGDGWRRILVLIEYIICAREYMKDGAPSSERWERGGVVVCLAFSIIGYVRPFVGLPFGPR